MKANDQEKSVSEFLLMEYQELLQEYGHMRDEGVKRLNYYLTLTSSILGGLILLSRTSLTMADFQSVSIGASAFLLLIGLPLYRDTIYRDKVSDALIRETSRVRHYFVSQNPALKQYISRPIHDEPTGLIVRNASNIRATMQYIISLLTGAMVGLSLNLFLDNSLICGIVGVAILTITYLILNMYAEHQYKMAVDSALAAVRFPKNDE